jgi:hypothetical protein
MKSEIPSTPHRKKTYDEIEDAIDLSKKGPTRTWDGAAGTTLKRNVDKGEQDDDSQKDDKVAARA